MPSRQRRRVKRRTIAEVRAKRRNEESEFTGKIDGQPIFTEEDIAIDDDRIEKLLQTKRAKVTANNNDDSDDGAVYLTDLLDFDDEQEEQQISNRERKNIEKALGSNDATNDSQASHEAMLKDIFGNEQNEEPIVMGNEYGDSAFEITHSNLKNDHSGVNDENGTILNNENKNRFDKRLTMSDMMRGIKIPVNKLVKKQINEFEDSQEIERLKLHAQTKISDLTIEVGWFLFLFLFWFYCFSF